MKATDRHRRFAVALWRLADPRDASSEKKPPPLFRGQARRLDRGILRNRISDGMSETAARQAADRFVYILEAVADRGGT